MRIAPKIELTDTERAALLKWSRGRSTASRLVLRAKIVLAAAEGLMNQTIAAKVGTSVERRLGAPESLDRAALGRHRTGRSATGPQDLDFR